MYLSQVQSLWNQRQLPSLCHGAGSVRKVVNNFNYAILIRLDVPSEEEAGPEAKDKKLFIRGITKLHEIVSKVEAEAFYDGYHLALGFASDRARVFLP